MKSTNFNLVRYDADEGFVFDWAEPRYIEMLDEETNEVKQVQEPPKVIGKPGVDTIAKKNIWDDPKSLEAFLDSRR